MVLQQRELVVVRRRTRESEAPRRHGERVRPVCQCEVEVARARPYAQCAQSRRERTRLADSRTPAVAPDDGRLEPVQLEQLQRLRIFARGYFDLVAPLTQQLDQRPEHE